MSNWFSSACIVRAVHTSSLYADTMISMVPLQQKLSTTNFCCIPSRCLPEPVKAQEFLKKLTSVLQSDNNLLALFERIVDPDISCKDCSSTGVSQACF